MQWWAVWYPGAEPGGGGYVAQRMLAAKDERHAVAAAAFFNLAHYAIRPWPWIIVALASLIVFPDIESLRTALPQVDPGIIGHDLAYPAMLSLLPSGVLGFVVVAIVRNIPFLISVRNAAWSSPAPRIDASNDSSTSALSAGVSNVTATQPSVVNMTL